MCVCVCVWCVADTTGSAATAVRAAGCVPRAIAITAVHTNAH